MNEQNYANHHRFVKGFHFVLGGLLLGGTISSIVNLWVQSSKGESVFSAVLITLLFICGVLLDELVELTEKALKENLAPKEIKKAIKKWRPDFHRA